MSDITRVSDPSYRPSSIGRQVTGRARTTAQCVAAFRAFSALCQAGARPRWNVSPADTSRLTPDQFTTGREHGPHLAGPRYRIKAIVGPYTIDEPGRWGHGCVTSDVHYFWADGLIHARRIFDALAGGATRVYLYDRGQLVAKANHA